MTGGWPRGRASFQAGGWRVEGGSQRRPVPQEGRPTWPGWRPGTAAGQSGSRGPTRLQADAARATRRGQASAMPGEMPRRHAPAPCPDAMPPCHAPPTCHSAMPRSRAPAHISGSMTRSSGTWRGSEGSPTMWSTPAPMDWMPLRRGHCRRRSGSGGLPFLLQVLQVLLR